MLQVLLFEFNQNVPGGTSMSTSTQPTFLFLSDYSIEKRLNDLRTKNEAAKQLADPNALFAFSCVRNVVGRYTNKLYQPFLEDVVSKAEKEGRAIFRRKWLGQVEPCISFNRLNNLLVANGHNPIQAGNFGSDNLWLKRLAMTVAIVGIDLKKIDDYENYDYPEAMRRVKQTNPHITCVW